MLIQIIHQSSDKASTYRFSHMAASNVLQLQRRYWTTIAVRASSASFGTERMLASCKTWTTSSRNHVCCLASAKATAWHNPQEWINAGNDLANRAYSSNLSAPLRATTRSKARCAYACIRVVVGATSGMVLPPFHP